MAVLLVLNSVHTNITEVLGLPVSLPEGEPVHRGMAVEHKGRL